MGSSKKYTGIVLDGDFLKFATIQVRGKKVRLLNIDKIRLAESIHKKENAPAVAEANVFGDEMLDEEGIFGMDTSAEPETAPDIPGTDSDLDDFDFENLDDDEAFEETDMTAETDVAASNEMLIYNMLSAINSKRVNLGLSIQAGDANYQILRDVDFSKTKKKDLEVIVADRLEAIYGTNLGSDYYSYAVRTDGALFLASIDDEAQLLGLINNARDLYRGKIFINNILPDETLLLGLLRSNYELVDEAITCVLQFGETRSRILFLKGNQLWIVSPIVTEGVKSPRFLNTIFSKILFQLDTGEVPNLDQIIICNNTLGQEAVDFLADRFQDIHVSEFQFADDFFEAEGINPQSVSAFTTAIGAAWASSGFQQENFPKISFLPQYVKENQKVFKLQWHGMLLLLLILLTPIVANHFYTGYAAEIESLSNDVRSLESQIITLDPIVQEYNRISSELGQIQTKLDLLAELNQSTLQWSTNTHLLNSGIEDVNSIWITQMTNNQNTTEIQGFALYRDRIPKLAEKFHRATLVSVTSVTIRDREVYSFRYIIRNFVADPDIYNPKNEAANALLNEE